MKISLKFKELTEVLGYTNTILSDKSVDEKMKNVIFLVKEDSVKVVGYNALTFFRTELENVTTEDIPESGWEFQVKASALNKILGSFNSLSRTKVENIALSEEGVKIKATIFEEPIEEADARLAQASEFLLENAPIITSVSKEIHMEFPEEVESVVSEEILMYMDALFPLMTNDSASSMGSKINFAEDYVFVITSYMSSFFVNKLPEAFKDLTLGYSSVGFLKKLCEVSEEIGVSRLDKYLCIQSGMTEAFMKYQKVKVPYKTYVTKKSKEKGIVVDRLYLKDVLKRMSNTSPDGVMTIEGDELLVKNDSFTQVIPLNKVKEGTSGISFKVSIQILDKIIIGSDNVFDSNLFMYFVETGRGYYIYVSDKSAAWFSNTRVTRS